ncbi:mobile element protein [Microcystis aeruginosa NIES-44]|jgi:transposase|uniref:Mobile element protein n=1 Tax=Microcystis aeruginosa NIES-44 TaxID=449439 RepID=A0A0A1VVX9_MICAE|nr:mobile element protein [Microcystis aeruginosa NIES-44]
MPSKKYIVDLTPSERSDRSKITNKGKTAAYKINHARILLKADINQEGGGWTDSKISESLNIGHATIERIRKRFVEEGIESALNRREQKKRRPRIIDGEKEADLMAIACSETPREKRSWTLQMLADKMVELKVVEQVSIETIRQSLKKTNLNLGSMNVG